MRKIGRNDQCLCGSGKKYKKCCIDKIRGKERLRQRVSKITRQDFISGPYKKCPNQQCLDEDSFGVFIPFGDSTSYSRECIKCGYKENFNLPNIQKKVLYLDQFVISNLIKLLDKSHPSHERIKLDPFWETLFIKLEAASKSQAIICPDSFYHLDESLMGGIDFKLMKRLYEHFSGGKTLYSSVMIEKNQITKHFDKWLENKKVKFEFDPEDISFGDLHTWSIGLMITAGGNPYRGQVESLQKVNTLTRKQLEEIWKRWKKEKNIKFVNRVKQETLGLGKGIFGAARQFSERRKIVVKKIENREKFDYDLDELLPPMTNDILDSLFSIARKKVLLEKQILVMIIKYFSDVDSLLEVPCVRISSVMFAGLAHRAASGKKKAPKSTVDVQFISSYLPYCDALFIDKESDSLLTEFPKLTPEYLRLKEFSSKIFSLSNKKEFLDYLDQLIVNIPESQINILRDIDGEDYAKPYWGIIEHEKRKHKR